jgi:hypothetical protein
VRQIASRWTLALILGYVAAALIAAGGLAGCGSGSPSTQAAETTAITTQVPTSSSPSTDPPQAASTSTSSPAPAAGSFLTPGPPVIVTINNFRYRVQLIASKTTVQPLDSDAAAPGFVHLEAEVQINNLQSDRPAALSWAANDPMDTFVFEATKQAATRPTYDDGTPLCTRRFCPLIGFTHVYLDAGNTPGDITDGYDLPGLPADGSTRLWYVEFGNNIRESATGDQVRLTVDHQPLNSVGP